MVIKLTEKTVHACRDTAETGFPSRLPTYYVPGSKSINKCVLFQVNFLF